MCFSNPRRTQIKPFSVHQIIASRPRGGRRGSTRRTSAKSQVLGNAGTPPTTRARAAPAVANAKTSAATQPSADKIIVSNLPNDVNEVQVKVSFISVPRKATRFLSFFIQELFFSTVGPLKDVTMHYDAQGRSKGVASVLFQRRGDGTKAFQQYNNRLIDGS